MPSTKEAATRILTVLKGLGEPERDVSNPASESAVRKLAAMLPDTASAELAPKPAAVLAPVPEPVEATPQPAVAVPGWDAPEEALRFGAAFDRPAATWTEAERKAYEEPLNDFVPLNQEDIQILVDYFEAFPGKRPGTFAQLLQKRQVLWEDGNLWKNPPQPMRRQYRDPGAILIGHR